MLGNTKQTKWIVFFVSLILGIFIGIKTYYNPISKTLMLFRMLTILLAALGIIIGEIGVNISKKYDYNEDLIIDTEVQDYFDEVSSKFRRYKVLFIIVGVLLLAVTFIGEFHMDVMAVVTSIYYFSIFYIYVFPIFDEIISIIHMMIDYQEM